MRQANPSCSTQDRLPAVRRAVVPALSLPSSLPPSMLAFYLEDNRCAPSPPLPACCWPDARPSPPWTAGPSKPPMLPATCGCTRRIRQQSGRDPSMHSASSPGRLPCHSSIRPHTSATAIEKHKGKACSCGANAVYVQSRHDPGGLDLATVTMVAFRYRKCKTRSLLAHDRVCLGERNLPTRILHFSQTAVNTYHRIPFLRNATANADNADASTCS